MIDNKQMIEGLVSSISDSVASTRTSLQQIKELELVSRKIDKIVVLGSAGVVSDQVMTQLKAYAG